MNDNQDKSAASLTFSQRHGYEPLPEPMRLEEISDALRREIWNETRRLLQSMPRDTWFYGEEARFIERVLGKLLKKSEDEIRTEHDHVFNTFKRLILEDQFNQVLDLIELIVNDRPVNYRFADKIACLFEEHAAAYWLDTSRSPFQFMPRGTKEQGEATRAAIETLRKSDMESASIHLRQAATHINAGQFADSVCDSISAVESVARRIAPDSSSLGDALNTLERKKLLKNKQLKAGFEKIYAYTNSEQGIRHALIDKDSPDVDLDEAVFMFGACASFAAYLASKHRQAQ